MPHTAGPFHVETRHHVHAICCKPTRKGEHPEVVFVEITATSFPGAPPGDLSAGSITAQQRPKEELAANAALFAAAPDLLKVCVEICRDQRVDLVYSERRMQLYNAVLKAGVQP